MDKEEIEKKMEELRDKMKGLEGKAEDATETAQIVGMYAKDKVDEVLAQVKSNINALKENYIIFSERAKGRASSELLKAQMNFDAAKKDLEEKKAAHDKEKLAEYIEETIDYASACIELSNLAEQEAKLALLEATKAQAEYEEKYAE